MAHNSKSNMSSGLQDSEIATIDGRTNASLLIGNTQQDQHSNHDDHDQHPAAEQTPEDKYRESLQNLWMGPRGVLAVFTLINFMVYFDRGASSPASKYIAVDSSIAGTNTTLSDAQVGIINSVFVFGYIVTAPIAISFQLYLTSLTICKIGVACWCGAVLTAGFAHSYPLLLLGRAFVGIGEASYAGFSLTIIDNIAPPKKRSVWISIFYATIPLSTACGIAISGIICTKDFDIFPGWRVAFFVETIPMLILLGFLIAMPREYNVRPDDRTTLSREDFAKQHHLHHNHHHQVGADGRPKKKVNGSSNNHDDDDRSAAIIGNNNSSDEPGSPPTDLTPAQERATEAVGIIAAVKHLACNGNYILVSVGYAGYTFVLGALSFFAINMLTQSPMNVSTVEASLLLGATTALIGLFSSAAGGIYVDYVGGSSGWEGVYRCCAFMAVSVALGYPVGLIALFMEHFALFTVLFVWTTWWLFIITGPINCAALSVVPSEMRPYSVSFNILIIHALGDLPSTTLVGLTGDAFDGGCKQFDDNQALCESWNSTTGTGKCKFIPPPMKQERSQCVNDLELTIAMRIWWNVMLVALILWAVAAIKIKRQRRLVDVPVDEGGGASEDPEAERLVRDAAE